MIHPSVEIMDLPGKGKGIVAKECIDRIGTILISDSELLVKIDQDEIMPDLDLDYTTSDSDAVVFPRGVGVGLRGAGTRTKISKKINNKNLEKKRKQAHDENQKSPGPKTTYNKRQKKQGLPLSPAKTTTATTKMGKTTTTTTRKKTPNHTTTWWTVEGCDDSCGVRDRVSPRIGASNELVSRKFDRLPIEKQEMVLQLTSPSLASPSPASPAPPASSASPASPSLANLLMLPPSPSPLPSGSPERPEEQIAEKIEIASKEQIQHESNGNAGNAGNNTSISNRTKAAFIFWSNSFPGPRKIMQSRSGSSVPSTTCFCTTTTTSTRNNNFLVDNNKNDINKRKQQKHEQEAQVFEKKEEEEEEEEEIAVLFPMLSRCNHSCAPNAMFQWRRVEKSVSTSTLLDRVEKPKEKNKNNKHNNKNQKENNKEKKEKMNKNQKEHQKENNNQKKKQQPKQIPLIGVLVNLRPIEKDEEICISYINWREPRNKRQQILWERYGFECCCERCCFLGISSPQQQFRDVDMMSIMEENINGLHNLDSDNNKQDKQKEIPTTIMLTRNLEHGEGETSQESDNITSSREVEHQQQQQRNQLQKRIETTCTSSSSCPSREGEKNCNCNYNYNYNQRQRHLGNSFKHPRNDNIVKIPQENV